MNHFSELDVFLSDLLKKDLLFAAYSLPNQQLIHIIIQNEELISECLGFPVDQEEGFLLSPFEKNKNGIWIKKNLYFHSDQIDFPILEKTTYSKNYGIDIFNEVDKEDYLEKVARFVKTFNDSDVKKAVLSRVKKQSFERTSLTNVFMELNNLYSDSFTFMVNLPGQITWIGSSPETLISEHNQQCMTMALAATKKVDDESTWSAKEIEEQGIVSKYIRETLQSVGLNYNESQPFDKMLKSGIKHLCTNFEFMTKDMISFSNVVNALHPTPAVAGMPLQEALSLIHETENYDRQFYTGYLGPVNITNSIQLFVNLRSAVHSNSEMNLFLGGGLTKDSIGENEWEETEIKSKTLLKAMEVVIN